MSRVARRAPVVLALLSLALLVGACRPKEGGKCKEGKDICTDAKNALHCDNGIYEKVACRGPQGCSKLGSRISCDDSLAAVGDNCMDEAEDFACSQDKKTMLSCKAGKFELNAQCRGQTGCEVVGRKVRCDTALQQKGDPCKKPGVFACATDFKTMLICRDNKMDTYRFCRGQNGCSLKGNDYDCDLSVSELGDPCGVPGMLVCASDGKNELVCRGGKFEQSRVCKKGCSITSTKRIVCEN